MRINLKNPISTTEAINRLKKCKDTMTRTRDGAYNAAKLAGGGKTPLLRKPLEATIIGERDEREHVQGLRFRHFHPLGIEKYIPPYKKAVKPHSFYSKAT